MFLMDGRCKGCDPSSNATGDGISGRRILESGIPIQKERSGGFSTKQDYYTEAAVYMMLKWRRMY
jgi:hypothetical protein